MALKVVYKSLKICSWFATQITTKDMWNNQVGLYRICIYRAVYFVSAQKAKVKFVRPLNLITMSDVQMWLCVCISGINTVMLIKSLKLFWLWPCPKWNTSCAWSYGLTMAAACACLLSPRDRRAGIGNFGPGGPVSCRVRGVKHLSNFTSLLNLSIILGDLYFVQGQVKLVTCTFTWSHFWR